MQFTDQRTVTASELSRWKSVEQRTPEWYQARNTLLTASDIPPILELSPFCTKYELFQKKLEALCDPSSYEEISDESPSLKWGQEHEPLARSFYESMPLANGPRYVHEVGLVRHPSLSFLGASPDGVVQSKTENGEWWLLEIKCPYRRHFHVDDKTIPLYIWVQVQIQLEVCDIPFCHLFQCRYVKNEFGESKLVNRKLSTIRRNKSWFQNTALPAIREFWCLLQRAIQYEHVKNPYPNPSQWVSMKSFTGHLLSDPILDWLDEYRFEKEVTSFDDNRFSQTAKNRMKNKDGLFRTLENSLRAFCRENNYDFCAITPLEEREREALSVRRFNQTKQAIEANTPVISRPVLLNYGRKAYGIPDMLIRNDVALEYFREKYPHSTTGVGFLETSITDFKEIGYVLICFTLRKDLRRSYRKVEETSESDSDDASMSSDYEEYRVHKRTKTFSLPPPPGVRRSARIARQEDIDYFEPEDSEEDIDDEIEESEKDFRFFRKWDKVLRVRYSGFAEIVDALLPEKGPCTLVAFMGSWFCHVANPVMVDFVKQDVHEGTEWARTVKREGRNWLVSLKDGSIGPKDVRLMPNMCNRYDQRWRKIKKELSERWGELTLLWYCGVDQRKRAHDKGIFSWKDTSFTSTNIVNSFYSDKKPKNKKLRKQKEKEKEKKTSRRRRIMGAMIRLNRTPDKVFRSYHPKTYPEPFLDMPSKTKEFFVDFEVLPNMGEQTVFSERRKQPKGMIYLIGMGWKDHRGEWVFRSFVASALTSSAERAVLKQWWQTVRSVKKQFKASKAVLYHWSPAEPRFLKNAMARNHSSMIEDDIDSGRYEFRDLMEMFLDAEVVVRGVWGYSVKDVAKGLYKHGLLPEVWEIGEKGNTIDSGEGTLATATGCYRNAARMGVNITHVPDFASLRTYNEMDCRVLFDLLGFMREHVYEPREQDVPQIETGSPMATKSLDEVWGKPVPPLLLAGERRKRTKKGTGTKRSTPELKQNEEKDSDREADEIRSPRRKRRKRGSSKNTKD